MKAVFLLCLLVGAIAGPQPKFPNDWTATEANELAVYQGDFTQSDDKYCCALASNCQVQTEYQQGKHYFDYTHNRTRWDDSVSGQTIVYDFKIQKEMLVVDQSCKEYCPLQGDTLSPGFLDKNATDLGPVQVKGKTLEKWQWKETILGIIVMEIDTVFVDQSSNPAVPVMEQDQLTPFGQPIGGMDTQWDDFTGGTPDPSLFIVNNVDKCPMSPNCGSMARQVRRLRYGAWKTWAKYHQERAPVARGFKTEL
jgi:hypothetical protein